MSGLLRHDICSLYVLSCLGESDAGIIRAVDVCAADRGERQGVTCDIDGAYVADVPLLCRVGGAERPRWSPREVTDLEAALSACYGLPIDFSRKAGGLAAIARALDEGNVALAQIATLHLRLPPPPLVARTAAAGVPDLELALQLYWSDLLKGDWDPEKHPRTGTRPNPGWFAEVPREPRPPAPGWPSRAVNRKIRDFVKRFAVGLIKGAPLVIVPVDEIATLMEAFRPTELNHGEERAIAQLYANFTPPKTLGELQTPNPNFHAYERHHIVEQNPANRARFGDAAIDDPSNIVYIPRLKHEEITAEYNSKDTIDPLQRVRREVVNEMDFSAQRQVGLQELRERGVLK